MENTSILIVDDDPYIINLLGDLFESEGWDTRSALTGEKALELFDKSVPDLTVLDIGLPGVDGYQVCREITARSISPVIMLSARDGMQDKVKCLQIGADDYVTKPFKTEELLARTKAALRRYQRGLHPSTNATFTSGAISIDFHSRRVKVHDQDIKLTRTEYSILQELALNAGNIVEDKYLLQRVWGPQFGKEREYLYVHINHLRSKIEPDPQNPKYIITVPGLGYMFRNGN